MFNKEIIAEQIYSAYIDAVGGVAFNGNPLPVWDVFVADPSKKKQSDGWLAAADRALSLLTLD